MSSTSASASLIPSASTALNSGSRYCLNKFVCLFLNASVTDFSIFSIAAALVADLSVLNGVGLGLELAVGLGLAWPKQMEAAATKVKQQRLNSIFIRDF